MIKFILIAIALVLSSLSHASTLLSDDFNPNTAEPNPAWQFYDPQDTTAGNDPGQSTLTFNGTNALISIPAGSNHDLWLPPNNKAPRLLQAANNENFQIEAKFETIPITPIQSQGIIIEQSHNIFLRFDIYYDSSELLKVYVAYVNGAANTSTVYKSSSLPTNQTYPRYQRVTRSGDQWTFYYSVNGTTWTNVASFTKNMTVTAVGVFAGTSGTNPAFLSSVDYFKNMDHGSFVDNDVWSAPAPVINTWYGYNSPYGQFGQPGIPQQWANILGNAFSNIGLSALTYKVNGGAEQSLAFGSDTRRLVRQGDFNIELDHSNLNFGSNSVQIKATDSNGLVASKTVTLDYAPGNQWPLPYTANWQSTDIQHIESIAHIVDGLWMLTPSGIRTKHRGYDRIIDIGDINWSTDNMAVTVPVTPHSSFTGLGFGMGWQGHEGSKRPRLNWPLQTLAWIRGPISSPTVEIVTYQEEPSGPGLEVIEASQPISMTSNTTYMLKAYSEPLGNGMSRFYVKFWQQGAAEPPSWNIQADIPGRDGSVILVAYNGDATFGNVSIGPLSGSPADTTPPVISTVQASSITANSATISWTTNEASNSVVNYGLTSSYGSNSSNASLVTAHSISLTGLSPSTTYHYRVNSTDANNNPASSGDFTFTTAASGGGSATVLYRVNAGGASLIDIPNWSVDTSASPSPYVNAAATRNKVSSTSNSIDLTDPSLAADVPPMALFQKERYDPSGASEMQWTFPVTAGSSYEVRLYFAETYAGAQSVGARKFNVTIEGALVLNNYDVFAEVGANKGVMKSFTVTSDASLNINFGHVTENPAIKGIEIVQVGGGGGGGDTTAPVISNVQASSTSTGATITWTTNEASDSAVDYGLTTSYGATASNASVVTSHSVNLTGLTSGTTYQYRVSSKDASNNTGSSSNLTFTTTTSGGGSASGMVSDGFNSSSLNTALWTVRNPKGDGTVSTNGSQLVLSIPAGTAHDLWLSDDVLAIAQDVPTNTDFVLDVQFDSPVTAGYQTQGIRIKGTTGYIRSEFHHDGTTVRAYAATIINGTRTKRFSKAITLNAPMYMRLTRAGGLWTMQYSANGTNWTTAGTFTQEFTLTEAGPYAGNAGSSPPQHTALVNYFTAH